jgi:hypothetical protein
MPGLLKRTLACFLHLCFLEPAFSRVKILTLFRVKRLALLLRST